jgi:hypothetical protein
MNLIDDVYGYLRVLKRDTDYVSPKGQRLARWKCVCTFPDAGGNACGAKVVVNQPALRTGNTKSCGKTEHKIKISVKAGDNYHRLTVLRRSKNDYVAPGNKQRIIRWVCRCDCGSIVRVLQHNLIKANGTASCGCYAREVAREQQTKHNLSYHPLFATCKAAISRCHDKSNHAYKDYGKRGITVYGPWRDKPDLMIKWLMKNLGNRPSKRHSLDRIDNDKGYQPGNLRWSTKTDQARNRRSTRSIVFRGTKKSLSAWAEEMGLPYRTLWARMVVLEWSVRKAFMTPIRKSERI